jgi:hypothetical protein
MMKFSVPLCLLLAVASVQAFVSPSSSSAFMRTQRQIGGASSSLTNAQILRTGNHGAFRPLQMSEEDSSSEDSSVSVDVPQVVEPVKPNEPEGSSYPLDVPSPLLLASSMVLAIGATGEFSPQMPSSLETLNWIRRLQHLHHIIINFLRLFIAFYIVGHDWKQIKIYMTQVPCLN